MGKTTWRLAGTAVAPKCIVSPPRRTLGCAIEALPRTGDTRQGEADLILGESLLGQNTVAGLQGTPVVYISGRLEMKRKGSDM